MGECFCDYGCEGLCECKAEENDSVFITMDVSGDVEVETKGDATAEELSILFFDLYCLFAEMAKEEEE